MASANRLKLRFRAATIGLTPRPPLLGERRSLSSFNLQQKKPPDLLSGGFFFPKIISW